MRISPTISMLSVVFANHDATGASTYVVSPKDFTLLKAEAEGHHAVKITEVGDGWVSMENIMQQSITVEVDDSEPDYDWRV